MAVIWNLFGKDCVFSERDTNVCFFFYYVFWVSCLSNKSLSYKWVASILRRFLMILSPNKLWCKIFFLLLSKALWLRINSCYSKLFSILKKRIQHNRLRVELGLICIPCMVQLINNMLKFISYSCMICVNIL